MLVSAELVAFPFPLFPRLHCWECSEAANGNPLADSWIFSSEPRALLTASSHPRKRRYFLQKLFCYSPHLLAPNLHLLHTSKNTCLLPACLKPATFYPDLPIEILFYLFVSIQQVCFEKVILLHPERCCWGCASTCLSFLCLECKSSFNLRTDRNCTSRLF